MTMDQNMLQIVQDETACKWKTVRVAGVFHVCSTETVMLDMPSRYWRKNCELCEKSTSTLGKCFSAKAFYRACINRKLQALQNQR